LSAQDVPKERVRFGKRRVTLGESASDLPHGFLILFKCQQGACQSEPRAREPSPAQRDRPPVFGDSAREELLFAPRIPLLTMALSAVSKRPQRNHKPVFSAGTKMQAPLALLPTSLAHPQRVCPRLQDKRQHPARIGRPSANAIQEDDSFRLRDDHQGRFTRSGDRVGTVKPRRCAR
jgi:hypothetical protein